MHKALLGALKKSENEKPLRQIQTKAPPRQVVLAEVIGKANSVLECPVKAAKTFAVYADLSNASKGKQILGIEFAIDTGCQFALVIPAFLADQLYLDETNLAGSFTANTANGESQGVLTYNILFTINGIQIQTTAAVIGSSGVKALIGTELLSLFNLETTSDICKLTLVAQGRNL